MIEWFRGGHGDPHPRWPRGDWLPCYQMGRSAARSKGGKCKDGLLTVRRIGQVEVLSEERKTATTQA